LKCIDLGGALHVERLMGSFLVELLHELVELGLLLQVVHARRPGGLLLERETHPLVAAVLLRMAGLDAPDGDAESQPTPSLSHQTESFERLNRPLGLANGTPLSERMACGRPRSRKSCLNAVTARSSRVGSVPRLRTSERSARRGR
jgi:hypothetical protein